VPREGCLSPAQRASVRGPVLAAHEMPPFPIAPDWREQPRMWGHAFHPMCTYLGAFPAALAHALVARYSRPGDVVLDPFCGRGTVPLQACVERRIGVGGDANPLAALLTGAKVDPPTRLEAEARLATLRIEWSRHPGEWRALAAADRSRIFHPTTLAQLLYLRARLERDARADRFLLATLAGTLHGRTPGYLTDAMHNGFSRSPGSVARARAEGAGPPERDAFQLLGRRLARLYRDGLPAARGVACGSDARRCAPQLATRLRERGLPDRARLVVTSPPYLRTVRYGSANWLRLWLMGEDAAGVDARLDSQRDVAAYAAFLREVLAGLRPILTDEF